MWCCRQRARLVIRCLSICFLGLIPAIAVEALELETAGDFIIEPSLAAANADDGFIDAHLAQHGARLSERVAHGAALRVRPMVAAATRSGADGKRSVTAHDISFCKQLMDSGVARSCSPNYIVRTSALPNDAYAPNLWGMLGGAAGMNASSAWDVSTGSADVVVAVVDTGVDYTHPDLAQNMWINSAEIPGNGIDDDGNGYVDDIHGINAAANSGNPYDNNGHGTHVAGTIGARGNNAIGVAGVNWNVRIMGLKFLGANGSGTLADAIKAIDYLVMMKNRGVNVRVANNSWGGGGYSAALYNAIAAAQGAGVIFVAAAGNEANDNDVSPSYPASYELDNVVSVAALDSSGNLAGFSNFGALGVDIAAPGVGILSTVPGGYQNLSGTSMATPHVAGALALLLAYQPTLSAAQAINRLYDSGVGLSSLQGLIRTGRRTDVDRMLRNLTSPVPPPPAPVGPCSYGVSSIPYVHDSSLEQEAVLVKGDELNYQSINFPFAFTFKGTEYWSAKVSLNGVIYFKGAPTGMDYRNTATAPASSIASLHTDLVSSLPVEGVRVKAQSDRVTVSWIARHYMKQGAGSTVVRTVLYPDGVIENYIEHPSQELAKYVNGNSTIGINGAGTGNAETVGFNNENLGNYLATRFTPQCGDETPGAIVTEASSAGLNRNDEIVPFGLRGMPFLLSARGNGDGALSLEVRINGTRCQQNHQIVMQQGVADLWGNVPVTRDISAIRFDLVGANGSKTHTRLRIKKSGAAKAKASPDKRRLSSRTHLRVCERVVNSLS
ncbi:MAG: S8 family peptidase [Bdellovibrionota bacterium]|nr:MAG: S8 family peptidase [Bdellovibrionota bacterium]